MSETYQYSISTYPNAADIEARMQELMNTRVYKIKPDAMNRYLSYFETKCAKSKTILEEAKQYMPGGVQHNLAFNYPFPLAVDRAEGPYLYDLDGNRYNDYLQAGGPTMLGSNYLPVQEKAIEVIRHSSPATGLFHEYELKLAKSINHYMPWVEMFRSLASGTESDMTAIRIARCYTGNQKIIKVGGAYHGWSDQLVYSMHIPFTKRFEAHGIPAECTTHTQEIAPNDIEGLRKLLHENKNNGSTAAVIVEPIGPESGTRVAAFDFNKQARALCDEFGALLIFDEVVTAFRLGMGGAQGYFDVQPDLTVFGKIVAGGYPAAGGVGGKREVMACLAGGVKAGVKRAYVGGTLSANPLSCAAGHYAIEEIARTNAPVKAGLYGDKLTAGLQDLIDQYKLPFVVWNMGSIMHFEVAGMMYLDAADPQV
ncbi:aminotransferase class III-fold pyridoxal phosphate-dependent enzyme, partial [Christensenellaceae bacterium OttesenSCG-928-L17]|nr:aminotransferase class III-fold pyridoxal phosphate-dependent enzyme [Christensenellaceae bacterium OttesenSCG-928-L17]